MTCASAHKSLKSGGTPAVGSELTAKDPICGMMVDEKTAKFTSTSGGRTWYFCSAGCKATFEKNPSRYAK
ncbi:MAG TPA: YHS domain-containing protein [Thermoplasmata archaeon]|nr:YHS domain-containing protein [Thermoplasmata archaeon]